PILVILSAAKNLNSRVLSPSSPDVLMRLSPLQPRRLGCRRLPLRPGARSAPPAHFPYPSPLAGEGRVRGESLSKYKTQGLTKQTGGVKRACDFEEGKQVLQA